MASNTTSDAPLPADYYDSKVTVIIVVSCILMTITVLIVSLRIYTRKVLLNQLGVDDYMAIFSMFLILGVGIAVCCNTRYGLGRHVWLMQPENIPLYFRGFYVSIVMYNASLLAVKLTFLFQYYRILAVPKMRRIYLAAIIIVGCWSLSQVLIAIFACTPVQGFWDTTIKSTCIPDYPFWYINAGGNIITDICVFLLPLPSLSNLKLVKSQKIVLLGIFCLGFFTVIVSAVRISFLKLFEDYSWDNTEAQLWSMGEITSAIMCACLPTLRPLVGRLMPRLAIGGTNYEQTSGNAKDLESMHFQGSKLPSSESRDNLYESSSGKGGVGPFEMVRVRRESGDSSEDGSAALPKMGVATFEPSVVTEIGPTRPEKGRAAARGGIRVQREVYQVQTRE